MYAIHITPAANRDMMCALEYYDAKLDELGDKLLNNIENIITRIANLPFSFTIRYQNIRAAKVPSFPYLLFYKIDERSKSVEILRVFNTHQQPFWI